MTAAPPDEAGAQVGFGQLFKNANFFKFYVGQLISYLGDRIDGMAIQALLVAVVAAKMLPESEALKAQGNAKTLVTAILILPSVLLGPLIGTIVDRFDRRKLMMAMDVFRGTLLLAVAFWVNAATPLGIIYGAVFLVGVGTAVFSPAKTAFLPEIVPDNHLLRANSISCMMGSLMTAVGTPVGAALVRGAGYRWALVADGATYFASMASLLLIVMGADAIRRKQARESALARDGSGPGAYLHELADGFRYILRHRNAGAAVALTSIFYAMAGLVFAAINQITTRLAPHAAAGGTGADGSKGAVIDAWVLGCLGIGMFSGGVLAGRLGSSMRLRRLISASLVGAGMMFLVLGVPMSLELTCATVFIAGFFGGPSMVLLETVLQKVAPDAIRGRVFALNILLLCFFLMSSMGGATLLGGLLDIGDPVQLAATILSMAAAVCLLGAAFAWWSFGSEVRISTLNQEP